MFKVGDSVIVADPNWPDWKGLGEVTDTSGDRVSVLLATGQKRGITGQFWNGYLRAAKVPAPVVCQCANCPSRALTVKVWRYTPTLSSKEKLFLSWGNDQEAFGSWTEEQAIAIYNAIGDAVTALQ